MKFKTKLCVLFLTMGSTEIVAQTSESAGNRRSIASCDDPATVKSSVVSSQPNPQFKANCQQILASGLSTGSGTYQVDFDGSGPLEPTTVYCDMTTDGGGWTLVMNQVPSERLQYAFCTINPQNLGSLTKTYRCGNNIVKWIRPTVAWVLTDDYNRVYFRPTCVVDWENDLLNQPIGACNQGFTSSAFATTVSSVTTLDGSMGIGQNNFGGYCSIRAFMYSLDPAYPAGAALACTGTTNQTIRLWFK